MATPVQTQMQNLVNNPTLPPGAQFNPTMMNVQPGEELKGPMVNATSLNQNTSFGNTAQAAQPNQTQAQTYQATQLGQGAQMTGATTGGKAPSSDEVASMYRAMLGRNPEAAGLDFWLKQAQNGMTLDQMSDLIANSEEGKAAAAAGHTPDPNELQKLVLGAGGQVQAAQGTLSPGSLATAAQTTEAENQAGQATAQQGTVDPRSTVQGQLGELTQQLENGTASWANPAMRQANETMASRGLGNSSMAGAAVYNAAMESALPIAAQDAKVFETMGMANLANRQQTELFNATQRQGITLANLNNRQQSALQNAKALAAMDLANLNNRQQAAVINAQAFNDFNMANLNNQQQAEIINQQANQQALLSNQAAVNAQKQFNASSIQQSDQFFATLSSNIAQFNAAQQNAMNQFNTGQANAMKQFNANLSNMREQFNVANSLAIEQSNVQWRREINTANTAAKNAANQINAQNMLNLSNTALNNLWQQFRDEADYAFTAGENDLNRQHNMAMAALQNSNAKDMMNEQQEAQYAQLLGQTAGNILTAWVT